ncbi:MAG: OmpA family protein [Burkholderiaceae bacterium]
MNLGNLRDYTVPLPLVLTSSLLSAGAVLAQDSSPLDPKADVQPTQYESPLHDFRAFDPDESMQSWVEANRQVGEIGGWRTYLRQANPPKAEKAPTPSSQQPVEKPASATANPTDQSNPQAQQSPARQPSPAKQPSPAIRPAPVPPLAEGGNGAADAITRPLPEIPTRFKVGQCPRILTGLRIPIAERQIELTAPAKALLVKLRSCFKSRQYIIGGHTDGRGPSDQNRQLSELRAQAVLKFLLTNGTSPDRITAKGFGESRPVDTNRSKDGRARNRRIDFSLQP